MADKEEGGENKSRGNEWEVVSLTASAYAASPGPKEVELKGDNKGVIHDEAETSHPLFMSRHFVFPPSEHENLRLEPSEPEIHDDKASKKLDSGFGVEKEARPHKKEEEDLTLKGLNLPDEFTRIQFFDDNHKKEESIYSTAISSMHDERTIGGSNVFEKKEPSPDPTEHCSGAITDVSPIPKPANDDKHEGSNIPCEAWWRRSAASLYAQAKEANAFWSIFLAAAVMGLVILGQHWQQERWQILQLKWQSSIGNEKAGRISGPISRLKETFVGGQRRGSFIRTTSSDN